MRIVRRLLAKSPKTERILDRIEFILFVYHVGVFAWETINQLIKLIHWLC